MDDYKPSTYGDQIADVYDQSPFPTFRFTDACVDFLASIAGKRRVLELGIGTGRIAVPLAARGLKVHGIDASEKMVAKMRAKPGGEAIPVELGDFADVKIGGRFSLIFVVFNTFFNLLTQERQLRCFQRVARHLSDEGTFVMEAFVPDVSRYDRGQRVGALEVGSEQVRFEVTKHDAAVQSVQSAHVIVTENGVRLFPVYLRYAWPSELDLMAQLAGMKLRARYGGWNRQPFDVGSQMHVSLYELQPKASPANRGKPQKKTRPKK